MHDHISGSWHRAVRRASAVAAALGAVALTLTAAVAAAQANTSAAATASTTTCGHWRWPVKTGSDATRHRVSKAVDYTTIMHLDGLKAPSSFGPYAQNHRISWLEFHTWQLRRITLVAVKLEDDGDIHLRLLSAGKKMIAEIPLPRCVSSASPWKPAITSARKAVTSRYPVSHDWYYVNRTISIRGLGFFDEEHNVTGAAPNDVELHPVTAIWLPGNARRHHHRHHHRGGAWCRASASNANDGYPQDENVYITSNQPDTRATASSPGDTWSDDTNGAGSVTILLYSTPAGSSISVTVGAASCSTTAT
jgi:hypothetical protein